MSYDLAVWEGERPADDKIAGRVFDDLYDGYIKSELKELPSKRIAAYVTALLERWCDLTEEEEDTSPLVNRAADRRGQRPAHLLPHAVEHGRGGVGLRGDRGGVHGAGLLRRAAEPAQAVSRAASRR